MLVDNHPGAGGNIAAMSWAPGTEYTLHHDARLRDPAQAVQETSVRRSEDFAPVTQLTSSFKCISKPNPQLPAASAKELIALAKSTGAISYGSTGIGAPPHLLGELLKA
jgi:tripartite-type tricarboxylate transporter receptor subunit TctC